MKLYKLSYNFQLDGLDVPKFEQKVSELLGNVSYTLVCAGTGYFEIKDIAKDEGREIHLWFARHLPKSGYMRLQEITS